MSIHDTIFIEMPNMIHKHPGRRRDAVIAELSRRFPAKDYLIILETYYWEEAEEENLQGLEAKQIDGFVDGLPDGTTLREAAAIKAKIGDGFALVYLINRHSAMQHLPFGLT